MKSWKKEVLSTGVYLLIVLVATFFVLHYIGQRVLVKGESMSSTLSNGDNIIVDKLTYRFNDPERYDIIVFKYQWEKNTYYIKRIIGLPGETVYIDPQGNIYINDELLEESYGKEVFSFQGVADHEITLGEDEYFVLGDNRNNSTDSRYSVVGNVNRSQIVGRAWARIWPLDKIQILRHQ